MLEDENDMEARWTRNHAVFETSHIVVEGHACITTLKKEHAKYSASREAVRELIRQYAVPPVLGGWKQGIVSAFMRRFRHPDPEDEKLQNKLQKDLEDQCGMKPKLASEVAKTAFVYT